MGDEPVVKVHHAKELLQGLHSAGAWETGDGVHPGGEGDRSLWSDVVSEEGNGRQAKLTLGRIDDEAVLAEPLEQQPEV